MRIDDIDAPMFDNEEAFTATLTNPPELKKPPYSLRDLSAQAVRRSLVHAIFELKDERPVWAQGDRAAEHIDQIVSKVVAGDHWADILRRCARNDVRNIYVAVAREPAPSGKLVVGPAYAPSGGYADSSVKDLEDLKPYSFDFGQEVVQAVTTLKGISERKRSGADPNP
jgi:hypothetical protein